MKQNDNSIPLLSMLQVFIMLKVIHTASNCFAGGRFVTVLVRGLALMADCTTGLC